MTVTRANTGEASTWIDIRPELVIDTEARAHFRAIAKKLAAVGGNGTGASTISAIRAEGTAVALEHSAKWAADLVLCINILCDLRSQGWSIRVIRQGVQGMPPQLVHGSIDLEKARVREAHLVERNAQLSHPAVRRFVHEMERRRLFKGDWHSVFSLMRDGKDLARKLEDVANRPRNARAAALRRVIDPYVQLVQKDATCEFTGLALSDVWRYFRHTWTTTYQSTPGRKMFYLIRDRAAPNHPVVGIGALGSSIVQLSVRDSWIGWTKEEFVAALRSKPTTAWAHWVDRSLRSLIDGVLITDFVRDGVFTRAELSAPSQELIDGLVELSKVERRTHHLFPARGHHKKATTIGTDAEWRAQAMTHLFRSKRAKALADLLEARRRLQLAGFTAPTRSNLKKAISNPKGVRAIQTILRRMKAVHVGIDMMDITVCGAVAPYNRLLGGKLVSLLMASPIVVNTYNKKYRKASSVIASSIAGRAIRRRPHLVLLGTTSLYGAGASQYNRLRFPAELAGGTAGEKLQYIELGKTVGYGSYHFSMDTMNAIDRVLRKQQRGRPVNSIFGEGVNPKLRKVRSALDAVGFPSDPLLQHGSPRIIYAIPLATNFREVLVGRAVRPKYTVPDTDAALAAIVNHWLDRWLAGRIENQIVLAEVAMHTGTYPVTHGARVSLPSVAGEGGPLFEDQSTSESVAPPATTRVAARLPAPVRTAVG